MLPPSYSGSNMKDRLLAILYRGWKTCLEAETQYECEETNFMVTIQSLQFSVL